MISMIINWSPWILSCQEAQVNFLSSSKCAENQIKFWNSFSFCFGCKFYDVHVDEIGDLKNYPERSDQKFHERRGFLTLVILQNY